MSAKKQIPQDGPRKLSCCKGSVPEKPTDQQVEQARQDLGLPKKPKYKVTAFKMRKFKQRWDGEPAALAGQKA